MVNFLRSRAEGGAAARTCRCASSASAAGHAGAAEDGRGVRAPLRQRRLLRRREEARRDAADGHAASPPWRSWTRRTPASTSTRCARSPRASTRCATRRWASCSSPTTSGSSTTSRRTSVHVLYKGRIVRSGGRELAHELEAKGYDWITNEIDAEPKARRLEASDA